MKLPNLQHRENTGEKKFEMTLPITGAQRHQAFWQGKNIMSKENHLEKLPLSTNWDNFETHLGPDMLPVGSEFLIYLPVRSTIYIPSTCSNDCCWSLSQEKTALCTLVFRAKIVSDADFLPKELCFLCKIFLVFMLGFLAICYSKHEVDWTSQKDRFVKTMFQNDEEEKRTIVLQYYGATESKWGE